jgi:hypothetical protein
MRGFLAPPRLFDRPTMHLVSPQQIGDGPVPGHRDRPDRVLRDRQADGAAGLTARSRSRRFIFDVWNL